MQLLICLVLKSKIEKNIKLYKSNYIIINIKKFVKQVSMK